MHQSEDRRRDAINAALPAAQSSQTSGAARETAAVALALVYVGDQIGRLAGALKASADRAADRRNGY